MLTAPFPARAPRRSVVIPCEVVRERDFRVVARQMIDLSENGMSVTALEQVLTGEGVIVTFKAPFSQGWIDAEAVVARVVHGRRPGDRGPALGLWFDAVDAVSRARLQGQLGWFRMAAPRRRYQTAA
jgi:hypothetical protein